MNDYKILIFDKNPISNQESYKTLNINWGRTKNKNFSPIHSISSYLAMFAPSLPDYFIKLYTNENATVMDNFSGRGTTALVARECNRKFIGSDLNPYAYVLTNFKISKLNKQDILNLLDKMNNQFLNSNYMNFAIPDKYEELKYFYSDDTLRQLIFLREEYGKKWYELGKNENAIIAFALGLMHGKSKKDGSSIYFSIDMPNVISMAPNYVKNYVANHNLIKPKINIFENIKSRIENKFDDLLSKEYCGKCFLFDSTKTNDAIMDSSVDLVITSPPYLNIVDYKNSNWIKLWLLGYDRKSTLKDIKLSDKLKYDEYVIFIKNYLNAIYPKLKKNAKVCLVVGDIKGEKLIENVWEKLKNEIKYTFVNIYYDKNYKQNNKTTNMLNSKAGKATKIEKVLIIEKI
ncbi:DNA methylase [[Mycoplasma] phocae]|uniref:Methyltransferase n=1 Tax=[Mycoplasma] phocae TaxID=142651 RepID=A0A2Z5ISQ7_9BACT|nr:DNA methyltransferase [[Mycoplasma] phocae]AXE60868.1 DNA methylase [[Mycoplasma] phocae]